LIQLHCSYHTIFLWKKGRAQLKVLFSNTNYQKQVEYTSLISVVPPLDIAYCAALVRQNLPEIETAILDANVLGLTEKQHAQKIKEAAADVVVFTAATYAINCASRLATTLKDDEMTFVVVGAHGTALPQKTLEEFEAFDVVVRGEPEWTVSDLVGALFEHRDLCSVGSIHYRTQAGIKATKDRCGASELDELPFPARDLLPNALYSSPYSDGVTALRTTRGCPGRCSFCDGHLLYGRKTRMRQPQSVVDEIEQCVTQFQTKYFAIIDHTFTADRTFVLDVCNGIIERNLHRKIRWACNTRVDMMDDPMPALMRKAGCLQIGIGIESADDKQLETISKGISETQIKQAIKQMKRHGIIAMGYAIVGFPWDTAKTIENTRKKIFDQAPHTLQLSFATPLPGTAFGKQCKDAGIILSDNWDDYVFLRKSIVRNDSLSSEQIATLRADIVRSFYFRPAKLLGLIFFVWLRTRVRFVSAVRAFFKIARNMKV
jgi:radical SAM superfamily enzyme YgiQ (UPF0313 family)